MNFAEKDDFIMKITWLGTASLLVEYNDAKILFDPYLKSFSKNLATFPLDSISDVTAIFITHPHFDHFADMNIILSHCKANVYVCQRGIELAKKRGFDLTRFRRIKANDSLIIGDLRIKAYQSEHCKIDAKVIGKILLRQFSYQRIKTTLKIKKQNSFYSIDKKTDIFGYEILDEDKSVFIFGSANFSESVTYPTNMDLLVFPYQGRSDMVSYSMKFIDKCWFKNLPFH